MFGYNDEYSTQNIMNFEEALLKVEKPAQYLGNEFNCFHKDFSKAYIRFALCFPDVYSVGMSNLGFRIIYGLLNTLDDVVCERVFYPAYDLEVLLRSLKTGILSWESKKRLRDFDILGFSLSHEVSYMNVLHMLELSDIPVFSKERNTQDLPLLIAGGPCVLNPEPIADFFDLFIIGEAEETILEFIEIYRNLKKRHFNRRPPTEACLEAFKSMESVYIPSYYKITYHPVGTIKESYPFRKDVPAVVKKSFLKNIDDGFYPKKWLIPYTEIVHDRMILEIMRGCPNLCRFCQARVFYFPFRYRQLNKAVELAKEIFLNTGYETLSLAGLSVSDYPYLKQLIEKLNEEFKDKKVALSLSSLRERRIIREILSQLVIVKKTGLTFAPEAGSLRLRKAINKTFDMENFFLVLEEALNLGYHHFKLYFMIGLPSENEEDLEELVGLLKTILDLRKKISKTRRFLLNVSINTFIPKPHTPFQWLGLESLEGIQKKKRYILDKAGFLNNLKINFRSYQMSFIESLLCRGNRRLSEVIYKVYKKTYFSAERKSCLSLDVWQETAKETGLDLNFYVHRLCLKEEILPWDFIDTGISKEYLWQEFQKATNIY